MTDALFLTSDEIDGLATPAEYVEAVRDGYQQVGDGAPAHPRQKFHRTEPDGMFTSYAAVLPETGAMGGYMYGAGFGAGDAWFVTPLFDAENGEPLALLDGASMNPFKTGAAGAVAVDELARDDATTLAVIGSGSQARGQLHTTATVRAFEAVRVYSPTRQNREAFADDFDQRLEATVTATDSSADAIDGADVVVTATKSTEPVFGGDDLEPGTHVTAMGQYEEESHEIDVRTVERATYVPDLRERATFDAGAFLAALEEGAITEDHVHAELGEVVAGHAPGRTSDDEITVFDSGGTGIETVAAAHMLYERAREQDLGSTISFAPASEALTGRLPDGS
ncbi:ornithine cyclodeaminase family protein [Natronobacterium gregoryi]|uniref:Ornithine cyclodeaminase n=2 Tax=Natronobacterium gregoryi TaxID=44930 RepID=L0AMW4_NATGS|nr:ornithine cyclodeaminase family protein [Natronobacterium gregoryi]AFZ74420.1 putative ornithine cyclodeaminase, mu-crystallin [Natronobacterium gregoryi SP2]ELY72120.1 ornithine cyclodeaminase [Natronobacterium gregoryi SP2]PLK19749.1 ornithine cyclodeaminase [Natronobacterium gregoryi SP2]SFJ40660.1 ornithine cyclodeaminase [Natronobacterium gregoryi]